MTDAMKVLNYDGALGIQESRAFADRLLQLINDNNNVIINVSRIESFDLSCIQVLLAAKKLAHAKGLTVQLANQLSIEALFSLYTCGIIKHPTLSGREVNKALDELMGGLV